MYVFLWNGAGHSNRTSNTVPSRQSLIYFPSTDTNSVLAFAALEGGFMIADVTTSFSLASYFPIGTTAGFNGGLLYMQRDLAFDSNIEIVTSGTINGNSHTVAFEPRSDILLFPGSEKFTLLSSKVTGSPVESVDWNSTDSYLLAGTILGATVNELQIFSWNSSSFTLTPTASLNAAVTINEVAWQPGYATNPYFAAATSAGLLYTNLLRLPA